MFSVFYFVTCGGAVFEDLVKPGQLYEEKVSTKKVGIFSYKARVSFTFQFSEHISMYSIK